MPSTSHRHPWLSRRHKCVGCALFAGLATVIIFMNAGLFSSSPSYTGALCRLDDIVVQSSFDKAKFAGSWYGGYTKGLESGIVATLLEFYDVKTKFILKDDGNYDIKSVGGKFYGMWCPEGEGHGDARDTQSPQKLSIYFDTPTGKKLGTKPGWVLKTDYTTFAVMYSCWDETDDGHCSAKGAYSLVLQRKKEKLPRETMEIIESTLSRSCINPKAIKAIKHEGYCKSVQALLE